MPDADYFDGWYATMAQSPERDRIVRQTLGLPPELQSTSLLTWAGIADVVDALNLSPGDRLLDLACGRGGYGMEVARRTGAHLVGVDFSAVALDRARERAPEFGLEGRSEFRVGELARTGLPESSVDAVMCVDAIQFAEPPLAALSECRRVSVDGGRIALTWWEPRDRSDDRLPARLQRLNVAGDLLAAGFTRIKIMEMLDWQEAERALWEAALAAQPDDDLALRSLQEEAVRILPILDTTRRLFGRAVAPS